MYCHSGRGQLGFGLVLTKEFISSAMTMDGWSRIDAHADALLTTPMRNARSSLARDIPDFGPMRASPCDSSPFTNASSLLPGTAETGTPGFGNSAPIASESRQQRRKLPL